MAKRDNVRVFNPHTGKYEPAKADDAFRVEEHQAQIDNKPAPGDRSEEEIRELSPGQAGPVLTSESAGSRAAADNGGNAARTANKTP